MTALNETAPLTAEQRDALIKLHEYDELIFGGFICLHCTPDDCDDPDDNVYYPCPPLRAAGVTNEEAVAIIKANRAEVERKAAVKRVHELLAEVDRLKAERAAYGRDALNVRGILSPNGLPRRVPVEIGEELAPAVQWLVEEVDRLSSERDKAKDAARHMGRGIDVVALEIRRAVRLANAGDLAAAMEVITDFASEADWLDNLDDEDNFDHPSAPTVEQDRHSDGGA